jgi:hypothetical protein
VVRTYPFWPFWAAAGLGTLGIVALVLIPLAHIPPMYRYRFHAGNVLVVTAGGGIAIILWILAICLIVYGIARGSSSS